MKLNLHRSALLLLSVLFFATSCKKEYETIEEFDTSTIEEYIRANSLTGIKDSLGVLYQIIKPGSGADLKYTEVVPLIFTVRSLDGQYVSADTFAASNRYGAAGADTYYAGSVPSDYLGYFGREKRFPEDLKVAVVEILKKRGGKIRVIVPSREAYGRNGLGDIPGNASLDYSIKVLDENLNKIAAYDETSIQKYIQKSNLTNFTRSPEGLYYKILEPGSGSPIDIDSTITVQYTGKLFNGKLFDEATESSPASFVLSGVIPGWQKSIPLIKEGGSIRLLIPSALAYGLAGSRDMYGQVTIPAASCLDFEIKVTGVAVTPQ